MFRIQGKCSQGHIPFLDLRDISADCRIADSEIGIIGTMQVLRAIRIVCDR